MTSLWTERDLDIVETLARRVPMLSIKQVADIWWPGGASQRVVRRRLLHLESGRLVQRTFANVSPPRASMTPLCVWQPGEAEPDFASVSATARARPDALAVPLEIFYATRLAANLFGSSAGRLPELHNRSRDLAMSQVYVRCRAVRPADAEGWIGRAAHGLTSFRSLSPDAVISDGKSSPTLVVHRAGRWSEGRVERFHDQCAQSQLPYELW